MNRNSYVGWMKSKWVCICDDTVLVEEGDDFGTFVVLQMAKNAEVTGLT